MTWWKSTRFKVKYTPALCEPRLPTNDMWTLICREMHRTYIVDWLHSASGLRSGDMRYRYSVNKSGYRSAPDVRYVIWRKVPFILLFVKWPESPYFDYSLLFAFTVPNIKITAFLFQTFLSLSAYTTLMMPTILLQSSHADYGKLNCPVWYKFKANM